MLNSCDGSRLYRARVQGMTVQSVNRWKSKPLAAHIAAHIAALVHCSVFASLHASAADLCPKSPQPWQCVQVAGAWQCEGNPQTPPPDVSLLDAKALDEAVPKAADSDAASSASLDAETKLRAKSVDSADGNAFTLSGGVELTHGKQRLTGPQVQFDRAKQTASASGGPRLEDAGLVAFADHLTSDFKSKQTKLHNVRYALKSGQGNGVAERIIQQNQQLELKGVTFTSCPENNPGQTPAWQVRARRMSIDQQTQVGIARDFKLYLGKVPVIYLPYASFPTTNARKSGFLMPVFLGGGDGLDLSFPYYLNLAPNYDATLTSRIIQQRGFSLGTEFRHLGLHSNTRLEASYLPHDRIRDDNRYSFNLNHGYAFNDTWRFGTSLNTVSDDYYFEDLGDSLTVSSTSILSSDVGVYGRGRGWEAGAMADRYEIIDPANPTSIDPYRRAPRLFFNSLTQRGNFAFGVLSELAQFKRDAAIEGSRLDVTPFLRYEIATPAAFIRPQLQWRHTRYRLDGFGSSAPLNRNARRTLPIASVDMGLYFDRDNAFGKSNLRQTLEPRLYYLYSPFRDQAAFPVFDATELDFSFPQLFRSNRFSGADRQADANQIALALSSRTIDTDVGIEKLRLSVGQIRYFQDALVTLPGVAPFTSSAGVWVAEAQAAIGQNWQVSLAHQYDPELSRQRLSAVRLQRTIGEEGIVNVGYRYRANRIEQTDISALVPLNARWSAIGRWNYSLPERRTLEGLAGFQYESCCWRLRVLGRHYVRAGTLDGRNSLFFELQLNGLGVLGRKTDSVLSRAIVGFSQLSPSDR
jgi:LPS-assembly protein